MNQILPQIIKLYKIYFKQNVVTSNIIIKLVQLIKMLHFLKITLAIYLII